MCDSYECIAKFDGNFPVVIIINMLCVCVYFVSVFLFKACVFTRQTEKKAKNKEQLKVTKSGKIKITQLKCRW